MSSNSSVLIVATVVLTVGGCVLPKRLPEENPFRAGVVRFIEPGATTKVEIEETLGTPFYKFSDGQWWSYCGDRRMTEWFWFVLLPVGSEGASDGASGGTFGGGTFGGDTKDYSLVLRFGDNDIVNEVVAIKNEDGCTRDGTICHKCGFLEVVQDGKKTTLSGSLGTDLN